MDKLLGILPYIYFFGEAVQLGEVTFIGIPASQGKNLVPTEASDRKYLQELSSCFPTSRGLSTDKGAVKAITYFLLNNTKNNDEGTLKAAQKAITLLRYALLRPDNQALDNIESTYLYTFALPPVGSDNYHTYRGWVNFNQEIWVSPKHQTFPPPGWDVDLQLVHTSQLEDLEQIRERFYIHSMPEQTEAQVLLALEWYNQSFQKYSIRNIAGHLVDIAIAFETLLQLPQHGKTAAFKRQIKEYLGLQNEPLIDDWAGSFYKNVRSATVHSGKPEALLFTHPEAERPHLSFLWSARRIFRECVSVKAGLSRNIPNHRLIDELTSNEVHLNKLRKAGSFENIRKWGLLPEIYKLRQIYPAGNRDDIIWLGKELLTAYKEKFMTEEQSLPTLDLILDAEDSDKELGLKYVKFAEEFRPIYFSYIVIAHSEEELKKLKKPIKRAGGEQWQLESAIYHFATFAWWALLLPT